MVWSYHEYKKDESHVFTTLIKMAGLRTRSRLKSEIHKAIDIICQGEIVVPQNIREALRRVIHARQRARKFHTSIGLKDTGHRDWLSFIRNGLERLERHASGVKGMHFT
jgi:hypothetical protein